MTHCVTMVPCSVVCICRGLLEDGEHRVIGIVYDCGAEVSGPWQQARLVYKG